MRSGSINPSCKPRRVHLLTAYRVNAEHREGGQQKDGDRQEASPATPRTPIGVYFPRAEVAFGWPVRYMYRERSTELRRSYKFVAVTFWAVLPNYVTSFSAGKFALDVFVSVLLIAGAVYAAETASRRITGSLRCSIAMMFAVTGWAATTLALRDNKWQTPR